MSGTVIATWSTPRNPGSPTPSLVVVGVSSTFTSLRACFDRSYYPQGRLPAGKTDESRTVHQRRPSPVPAKDIPEPGRRGERSWRPPLSSFLQQGHSRLRTVPSGAL